MTVLVVACLLAAGLRFYQLGHVPNGFTADEAAHGYNAYSLLVTGADAFGRRLPLYVDNFGDSIEATYIYLIVPVVAALGLTEFAVRLPAAILGLLAVPAIYLVGRQLYGSTVAGIASLLIAASPWAVQVSRYASRAAFVPLMLCLVVLALLHVRRQPRHLPLAALTILCQSVHLFQSQDDRAVAAGVGALPAAARRAAMPPAIGAVECRDSASRCPAGPGTYGW